MPFKEVDGGPEEFLRKRKRRVNRGIPEDTDEDLYIRQLALYGKETMRKISEIRVLISGLQGLGAEIAKNLLSADVYSITLHDDENVELWDLSSNFLVSESNVGENRALACAKKLKEINDSVKISSLSGALKKTDLLKFQVVVFTDITLDKAMEYNDYCHNRISPISFIRCEARGLFGSVFCDFGPNFTVIDVDGEEPHTGVIASITDNKIQLSGDECEPSKFEEGNLVQGSGYTGRKSTNQVALKIMKAGLFSFTLERNISDFPYDYREGGFVVQVKDRKVLQFKPLREALRDPWDLLPNEFPKSDRALLLHLAFQALDTFRHEEQRFPVAGSVKDAEKLIKTVVNINAGFGEKQCLNIDIKLLQHFASGSMAVLNPIAAIIGGIVGQEVIKACTGKFHPVFQFFYFESLASLPSEQLKSGNMKALNCRYDAQISVFGSEFQKKLEHAKVFLIGSGGLGSEFLKNLALMGVSCSEEGKLSITDDTLIKKKDLTQPFIFDKVSVGKSKSTLASSAAGSLNSKLNMKVYQSRASLETEHVFDDAFWGSLNVVISAFNNETSKIYLDQKCLCYQKPLLASGTLGGKCCTQIVIPLLTKNYEATRDCSEKNAPISTIELYPYTIDHCLTWARSQFASLFEKAPAEVNMFLANPSEYVSVMRSAGDEEASILLDYVVDCLTNRCNTYKDCISWARAKFEYLFKYQVHRLLVNIPENIMTEANTWFWSPPKRIPVALNFNANDSSHIRFIMSASILRALTYGIPLPKSAKNPKKVYDAVKNLEVPNVMPTRTDTRHVMPTDDITEAFGKSCEDQVMNQIRKLEDCSKELPQGFQMYPIQFTEDDNTNCHMDLIVELANLRATNYHLAGVDRLTAKLTVGRILPAIATSTAIAAGLVCLELYKVLDGGHALEDYRNADVNLARPLLHMTQPIPPKVFKLKENSWTVWDHWKIGNDPTVKQLILWLENKGLHPYSIYSGNSLLYNSMFIQQSNRLKIKLVDLLMEVTKSGVPPHRDYFDVLVACEDDDGEEIEIPRISIYSRVIE